MRLGARGAVGLRADPAVTSRRLLGVALLVVAVGCGSPLGGAAPVKPVEDTSAEVLNHDLALAAGHPRRPTDYHIGADDLLEVTLFDIEGKNGEPRQVATRVTQSGQITLPLIGVVAVGGQTAVGAEAVLREYYRKYIHEPQVTVFVKEYRSYRVSVIGYVEKPGVYEVSGERSLLEVLAMAGGLNDKAGKTLQVSRGDGDRLESLVIDLDRLSREGDMRLNLAMLPGDVVNVPKAGVVYVQGSVRKPGAYRMREAMTVTQAIGAAGGPDDKLAKHGAVRLFRRGKQGERVEIPVDMAREDVRLVDNDIVVVPMSMPRYVIDRFIGGVGMGLSVPVF
jgi:polysaccharide export outer membrane protein